MVHNDQLGRCCLLLIMILFGGWLPARQPPPEPPALEWFLDAGSRDAQDADAAMNRIAEHWENRFAPLLVDLVQVIQKRDDGYSVLQRLTGFLQRLTGQELGDDLRKWRGWVVSQPYEPHPDYLRFKSFIYQAVDPQMASFFPPGTPTRIRLDEIEWGGVRVNGIPPLDMPAFIQAREARYLKGSNLVFGLSLNGESRAYPKRILAWHEMVRDRLGGVELTFVYCSLCGSALPYRSEAGGRTFQFGTSGLLFRSNKLMFDHQTQSLWSSLEGAPVVGPLADSGLQLEILPVVTTRWSDWKKLHPETTVLSLETGHQRDYSEGAAYREYFSTDELMFSVPQSDSRLSNKEEVLGLREAVAGNEKPPLALAVRLLKANPIFHFEFSDRQLVALTTSSGGSRIYEAGQVRFERFQEGRVWDSLQRPWSVLEEALELDWDATRRLQRVAAVHAFWFGWLARFPDTLLIRSKADAR